MIIRKLVLRDFRRFADYEVEFGSGFNVIYGNNEAGKSTLREAMTLALFQAPSTTRQDILGLQRWGSGERFAITLELQDDGRDYRLTKDFQARTACLEDLNSGESIRDVSRIHSRIAEMIGLATQRRFDSTARISQREMTNIQDRRGLADTLSKLVTGGDQDVQASKVLDDLRKALARLTNAGRVNPGPLYELPSLIQSKKQELDEIRQSLDAAEAARSELVGTEKEAASLRDELESKEQRERDYARLLELIKDLKAVIEVESQLEDRAERAENLRRAISQDEVKLKEYAAALAASEEEVAEMVALDAQITAVEKDSRPDARHPSTAASPAPRLVWISLGLVLTMVGLIGGTSSAALLVLALVGVGIVVWEIQRSRQQALAIEIRDTELRTELDKAKARLQKLLQPTGCGSVAELRAQRKVAEDLRKAIDLTKARLEEIVGAQTIVAVAADQRAAQTADPPSSSLARERWVAKIEAERRAASKKVRNLREQFEEPEMQMVALDLFGPGWRNADEELVEPAANGAEYDNQPSSAHGASTGKPNDLSTTDATADAVAVRTASPPPDPARSSAPTSATDPARPSVQPAESYLERYRKLQREIKTLKEITIPALDSEIVSLRMAIGSCHISVEEVNALEEEIQDLKGQLAAAQERQQVLTLTRDVLDESRSAVMVSARDLLARKLGDLVGYITSGRYTEVNVDPNDLSISIVPPERGEPVPVGHDGDLSTGTVDQIYLAARLALTDLLTQGRRPPFILDDPFVTFDPPRTAAVLSLCRQLAAEHQVLLFTCREDYCTEADHVVTLPEVPSVTGESGK